MATYFSSKDEKSQLLETFKLLDRDGDGIVSMEEIKQGKICEYNGIN